MVACLNLKLDSHWSHIQSSIILNDFIINRKINNLILLALIWASLHWRWLVCSTVAFIGFTKVLRSLFFLFHLPHVFNKLFANLPNLDCTIVMLGREPFFWVFVFAVKKVRFFAFYFLARAYLTFVCLHKLNTLVKFFESCQENFPVLIIVFVISSNLHRLKCITLVYSYITKLHLLDGFKLTFDIINLLSFIVEFNNFLCHTLEHIIEPYMRIFVLGRNLERHKIVYSVIFVWLQNFLNLPICHIFFHIQIANSWANCFVEE